MKYRNHLLRQQGRRLVLRRHSPKFARMQCPIGVQQARLAKPTVVVSDIKKMA